MVGEVDPEHVPDFSLIPVSGFEYVIDWLYWSEFVCVGFNSDTGVKSEREKVVDNLKSK